MTKNQAGFATGGGGTKWAHWACIKLISLAQITQFAN